MDYQLISRSSKHPMEGHDSYKANVLLMILISAFLVLTFIAFLLTEGRPFILYPILRKVYPKADCLKQYELDRKDRIAFKIALTSQEKNEKNEELLSASNLITGLKRKWYALMQISNYLRAYEVWRVKYCRTKMWRVKYCRTTCNLIIRS